MKEWKCMRLEIAQWNSTISQTMRASLVIAHDQSSYTTQSYYTILSWSSNMVWLSALIVTNCPKLVYSADLTWLRSHPTNHRGAYNARLDNTRIIFRMIHSLQDNHSGCHCEDKIYGAISCMKFSPGRIRAGLTTSIWRTQYPIGGSLVSVNHTILLNTRAGSWFANTKKFIFVQPSMSSIL